MGNLETMRLWIAICVYFCHWDSGDRVQGGDLDTVMRTARIAMIARVLNQVVLLLVD